MSGPRCEAIAAHFAWFDQQCTEAATGIVTVDGGEFWVCDEHRGVAR